MLGIYFQGGSKAHQLSTGALRDTCCFLQKDLEVRVYLVLFLPTLSHAACSATPEQHTRHNKGTNQE